MEKAKYETGQLLGVKEKNGKLVREYVAGFFGEEPIIKQRLMTPQEARRYREDVSRGKDEGKSESEAVRAAGSEDGGAAPKRRLVRKKKVARPGKPLRKKPAAEAVEGEEQAPRPTRVAKAGHGDEVAPAAAQMQYVPDGTGSNQEFIQNLINSEPDKPDFNPANTQAAINNVNKMGCPDMKIYRIGSSEGEKEGEFYTQKEYVARNVLGLPLWKPKPEVENDPDEKEENKAQMPAITEVAPQVEEKVESSEQDSEAVAEPSESAAEVSVEDQPEEEPVTAEQEA
jgi:hypothetical protein